MIAPPRSYLVSGCVYSKDRGGTGGLRIEVVNRNGAGGVVLAETTTDDTGRYSVSFTPHTTTRQETSAPNIQVRVSDGATMLGASKMRYNATPEETLDVVLPVTANRATPSTPLQIRAGAGPASLAPKGQPPDKSPFASISTNTGPETLVFSIQSPVAGDEVGRLVPVSGVARVEGSNPGAHAVHLRVTGVTVEVTPGDAVLNPTLAGGSWSCSTQLPEDVQGGAAVHITATAHCERFRTINGPEGPEEEVLESFDQPVTVDAKVGQPFVPQPVDLVFEPISYVDELLGMTSRYVKVDGVVPTSDLLAARLFQPLDRLTQPALHEEATRPVQQVRIAVEVLRGALGGPAPAALDQRYRGLAYQSMLLNLGTTYAELRLARLAQPEARQSLAGRLGIELGSVRPDLLDQITVSPDQITDAQLEQMFGYRSTAPADRLQPPTSIAGVLLSRQAALRSAWGRADQADRDGPDGPLPVIDPDVIGEQYLHSDSPVDPARALWTQRRDWLAARLDEVNTAIAGAAPTPDGLDAVVHEFLGDINLPVLATRDDEGADLSGDLAPFTLELDAFRYLVTIRSALAAGTLLDSEWQDVAAILVQARKRHEYPNWRQEERDTGVI